MTPAANRARTPVEMCSSLGHRPRPTPLLSIRIRDLQHGGIVTTSVRDSGCTACRRRRSELPTPRTHAQFRNHKTRCVRKVTLLGRSSSLPARICDRLAVRIEFADFSTQASPRRYRVPQYPPNPIARRSGAHRRNPGRPGVEMVCLRHRPGHQLGSRQPGRPTGY